MVKKFNPPSSDALASVDFFAHIGYLPDVVEIEGVVSLSIQGGWPRCDEYEVHSFEFTAWRRVGHPLINQTLKILRPVRDFRKALNDFEEGTTYRIQVLLSNEQTRAIFVKRLDSPVDSDFQAIADQLNGVMVIQTDRFGPLTLNQEINWFEGEAQWNGQAVTLRIEPDENLDITNQLKTADALFSDSATWGEKVRQFAVREKLELANYWQEEPVTAEDFLARMKLESISIEPEGCFEFWHQDGDIFWGHWILVRGSLKEGLTHSDIPG
jgi:hypothetical protein